MIYKVEFKDHDDRNKKIKEHSDKFLIEIQDTIEGKFLIFTDIKPIENEVEALKEANENLVAANEILTESLIDFKIAYMSVPCQSHQDYPVIIENLIEGATKDGE